MELSKDHLIEGKIYIKGTDVVLEKRSLDGGYGKDIFNNAQGEDVMAVLYNPKTKMYWGTELYPDHFLGTVLDDIMKSNMFEVVEIISEDRFNRDWKKVKGVENTGMSLLAKR